MSSGSVSPSGGASGILNFIMENAPRRSRGGSRGGGGRPHSSGAVWLATKNRRLSVAYIAKGLSGKPRTAVVVAIPQGGVASATAGKLQESGLPKADRRLLVVLNPQGLPEDVAVRNVHPSQRFVVVDPEYTSAGDKWQWTLVPGEVGVGVLSRVEVAPAPAPAPSGKPGSATPSGKPGSATPSEKA